MVNTNSNQQKILEARGVGKRREGNWVFRSVDISVASGECVGILGRSGVGKTTLLRGLLGFDVFEEGDVYVDGCRKSVEELRQPAVRREFGFMAQAGNLWPYRNVLDNVSEGLIYGLNRRVDESREIAKSWLCRLGLGQHLHKYPGELSGGEQRRVAMARALAVEPKALLLDEPTSGLDPIAAGELSELLVKLRSDGVGLFMVSHQIDLLRRMCDRAYFMHNGQIWESGNANDILTNPKTPELVEFVSKVRLGW